MRILAIGDFHGKFPAKLKKIAKSKEVDVVLSVGDFANADEIREVIFKHWTDKPWYEAVGLKKAKQLEKESFDSGLNVLKSLNKLGKKVFTILGNTDFYRGLISKQAEKINPGYYEDEIRKLENIILIDKKKVKIRGIETIGHGGYLDVTEFIKNPIDKDKNKQKKRISRYKKEEKKLNNLFLKAKPGRGFIFLIHYPPYKIFDKINYPSSPMHKKNAGWEPYNKIIKRHQPMLVICGHMHEHQGAKKLGKTTVVSVGPANEGKASIIDIDDKTRKIKSIRFLK